MPEIGNARALVFCTDKDQRLRMLVIDRKKDRIDYVTTPGGHMEEGETPEQTAEREVLEEAGLVIRVTGKMIYQNTVKDHTFGYFLGEITDMPNGKDEDGLPILRMTGPENGHTDHNNSWHPRWVLVEKLGTENFLPAELGMMIATRQVPGMEQI